MNGGRESIGLGHHAATFPDKPALILGQRVCSYGALHRRVNQLTRALRRAGVSAGDTVAAVLPNGFEWFEILNAVGRLGAQLVPVGYRLKGPEIAYMVADSRAKLILGAAPLRGEIQRAQRALSWPNDALWWVGDAAPQDARSYEAMMGAESTADLDDIFAGDGFNTLVYTSGTTGRPKGIDRHDDPATAHLPLLGIANLWGLTAADVHLVCGPLYHTAPSSYAQVHLLVGATVIMMPHFDAAEALRLVDRHRASTTFMVPTHFARILQLSETVRAGYDLSSLRLVLHSAAPCPPPVKRGIMRVFPSGTVTEFYGASESGFTKITAEEWLHKPGSVGRPWPGHHITIRDEQGRVAAPGEIGLIYVSSPMLGFRYRGAEEKTRGAFFDGAFTAGDLGYLDADGYLYIADRRTDLIISGGANIYPAEVENVLMQHPQIADVAVIGVPDPEMGQTVVAVVELRAGMNATADDIIGFARRDLAHYKCPRRVELVDTLPREPSGKVRKHELAERYGNRPAA